MQSPPFTSRKANAAPILSLGLSWIALNALNWGIGLSAGYLLGDTIGRSLIAGDGYWATSGQNMYLVNIAASLIPGIALGLCQGLLFQKYGLLKGRRWVMGTVCGFMIAAFIACLLDLRFLPVSNAVITIGGVKFPPPWLQHIAPWNRFLIATYGTTEPKYFVLLGVSTGLFQWALQGKRKLVTAWWIVWSALGFISAFVFMSILTLFRLDVILLSMFAGCMYGLMTGWYITSRPGKVFAENL